MLVSPLRNQSSSWMIDFRWSFFVVRSGNLSRQIEPCLRAENRERARPSPIRPRRALFEDEPKKIVILPHASDCSTGCQRESAAKACPNDSIAMILVMNRSAGGAEDPKARLLELFRAQGQEPRVLQPSGERDVATVARAAAESDDRIVVAAGGDGTIGAVAGALAGTKKVLGVLPVGTLNHFAKDLGIPLDLESAVRTITEGNVVAIDVGEVNGRIFINNSNLGIYPEIVSRREAQQHRLARGKWLAFFWAALQALRRFPFLDLRITFEGQEILRRTAFVFVGNNEYKIAGFELGSRGLR